MVTRRIPALLLLFVGLAAISSALQAQPQGVSYDDVMLVVNERSWASREIGAFFASRRSVPERNIYRMNIDTSETIDSASFQRERWKMEAWMREQGLVDAINYIVTTKGCPLRITTAEWDRRTSSGQLESLGGQASFEDCIGLMHGQDSTLILSVKFTFPLNRYFRSTKRFDRDPKTMPIYLVTRLDAYTVEQVKGMITRAETPAMLGEGLWVIDLDPNKDGNAGAKVGNDWLRSADTILRDRGLTVITNHDAEYLRSKQGVIGYASWGSNDDYSGGRAGAVPLNTWLNGSIAETFVSTGGRTFNPGSEGGQSLIADWIAEGANGVKGYTDEPYLGSIAHPDILFDRYSSGFNLAESFWAASALTAWRQVVIGDPKMTLASMLRLSDESIRFDTAARGRPSLDTITVTNSTSKPLAIAGLDLSGAHRDDFIAIVPSPATVAPGASLDIIVAFNPTDYDHREASLAITYTSAGDTRQYKAVSQLSGYAERPRLMIDGNPELVAWLGSGTDYHFTLRSSIPTDTLHVTNYSKAGSGSSQFTVRSEPVLPASITGDQTIDLIVTLTPRDERRDSATLTFYTLNGGSPVRLKIYGTGVPGGIEDGGAISSPVTVMPNPASTRSELHFTLERPSTVRVELGDLLGKKLGELYSGSLGAGEQRIAVDLAGRTAGTYLCRIEITGTDGVARTHVVKVAVR